MIAAPVQGSSAHEQELKLLKKLFQSHLQENRRGQVVIIHGPGTLWSQSLLEDFRRYLLSERQPYFEARCEGVGSRTYGALGELFTRYSHHLDELGQLEKDWQTRLYRLGAFLGMGELGAGAVQISIESPSPLLQGQLFIYEEMATLLRAFSGREPAVLTFRDVHQADSTTRAAILSLVEGCTLDPLHDAGFGGLGRLPFKGFLLLTMQSDAALLKSFEQTLSGRDDAVFIDLAGVDEAAVRSFLQSPKVVKRFLGSSGGHLEHLEALVDELPNEVSDFLARRLQPLEEDSRSLLDLLAIYNRPAAPELLARLLNLPPQRFTKALAALRDRNLVDQQVRRGQFLLKITSSHNRSLIYQKIPQDRRAAHHLTIGCFLESRHVFGQAVDIEEMAHHFLFSDDHERAIKYALTAAERLHMTFAHQRAAEYLEAILPRLQNPGQTHQVLERLIELYRSMNEPQRALRCCGLLKRTKPLEEQGDVRRLIVDLLLEMGRYQLALKLCQRNAENSRVDGLIPIQMLSQLAEAHYGIADYPKVLTLCNTLEKAHRSAQDPLTARHLTALLNTEGKTLLALSRYPEALRRFRRNLKICRDFKWEEEGSKALLNCGVVAIKERDFVRAEQIFNEALQESERRSHSIYRAFALLNLAVLHHQTFQYAKALECYLPALVTLKKSGSFLRFVHCALNLAELYIDLGDAERARALAKAVEPHLEQGQPYYHIWQPLLLARADLEQELYQEALLHLQTAKKAAQDRGCKGNRLREVFLTRARAHFHLGEFSLCLSELDKGSSETGEAGELLEARVLCLRGQVAHATGDLDTAKGSLDAGLKTFERLGHRRLLWEAQLNAAMLCFEKNEETAGRKLLEASRTITMRLLQQIPSNLQARFTSRRSCLRLFSALERLSIGERPQSEHPNAQKSPTPHERHSSQDHNKKEWRASFPHILGEDPQILNILHKVDRIAKSDSTALLFGESGTGKEGLADAIHQHSARSGGPIIKVNCGAFVENLLLSELFGHEKGAFTGAMSTKRGRFELADGGTLFLDEIGDISANTQVALLRVLQEGTFERVGGSRTIKSDVRIICATNRNLEQLVKTGTFRLDLYYRLKGIILELPPLRERIGDLPLLAQHFLDATIGEHEKRQFSREGLRYLMRYSWPGNIRELRNFVRSIALFIPSAMIGREDLLEFSEFFSDGEFIEATSALDQLLDRRAFQRNVLPVSFASSCLLPSTTPLPTQATLVASKPTESSPVLYSKSKMIEEVFEQELGLAEVKKRFEMECIRQALCRSDGNVTQAAKLLQMKRPRLSQIINANSDLKTLKQRLTA